MLLERFSLPNPDVRLIMLGDTLFKIKLYLVKPPGHDSRNDQTAFCAETKNQEDIEGKFSASKALAVCNDEKPRVSENPKLHVKRCMIPGGPETTSEHQKDKSVNGDNLTESSEDDDNQSVSILDGLNQNDRSSPLDKARERLRYHNLKMSFDKDDFTPSDEAPAKIRTDDRKTSFDKEFSSPDEAAKRMGGVANARLDKVSQETENVTSVYPTEIVIARNVERKRRYKIPSEEEAKKQRYSVSEYFDKNRHDVQEQDLQEHLRFQQLATPADETASEAGESKFQRVMNSLSAMKRLVFGSS